MATACACWGFAVRFLGHAITDLEPVLALMQAQARDDAAAWHARYVLLLWLSLACLLPFDLAVLDSSADQAGARPDRPPHPNAQPNAPPPPPQRLATSLRLVGQAYAGAVGREQDAAVQLLARLLTRPDVSATHLPAFTAWANAAVAERRPVLTAGVLATVAALLKHAPRRSDIGGAALPTLAAVADHPAVAALLPSHSLLRKLFIKVCQDMHAGGPLALSHSQRPTPGWVAAL
jgi:tubulin-specific chaperone D